MVQCKDFFYKLTECNEIVTNNNNNPQPTNHPITCSLGCELFEKMKLNKSDLAQIQSETGQEETFGSLLERCIRAALHMRSRGINPGDIISLCTNNTLDSCVPFIAAQFLGAVSAALDPSLTSEEMDHLINLTKPKLIFTVPQSLQQIKQVVQTRQIQTEIVVFDNKNSSSYSDDGNTYALFSQFVEPTEEEEDSFKPFEITDLKTTALIHFSSGSTGLPKGICISHFSMLSQVLNMNQVEDPDHEHMERIGKKISFPIKMLSASSLYWISGSITLISSVLQNFCRLLCLEFNASQAWIIIGKYKPLLVMLTPFFALDMIAVGRPKNLNLTGWFILILMGCGISKENLKRIKNVIPEVDVYQSYGQTEATSAVTSFHSNSIHHRMLFKNHPESIGLPVRGFSFRVVDTETNENVGPNKTGELQLKSDRLMNGYYNMDSSKSFTADGWLKTGDLVYFDEEFCFYIVDRIKEVFKYRGWFISPAEIEKKLMQHPAVKHCTVIGIPHVDGELPMGVVVLNEGYSNNVAVAEEIEKFVEERVSDRQRLRAGVRFIEEMPLSVTGKIKKREVEKMFRTQKML